MDGWDAEETRFILSQYATRLLANIQEAKRPLIIEFTGTPKSGKTTCVEAIVKFFRRHDFSVHRVDERASTCPIRDKHHLFFNVWTGTTSLTQLLEALEKKVHVIVLDRGLFDSVVWMNFLQTWGAITDKELAAVESFLLMDRWMKLVDIVVSMTVDPETALQREFQNQLTARPGSVMNEANLSAYNDSLRKTIKSHGSKLHRIVQLDTTHCTAFQGVTAIAAQVLQAADELVDERIAAIPQEVASRYLASGVIKDEGRIADFVGAALSSLQWGKRSAVEADEGLVQLIPVIAVRRNGDLLFTEIRGAKQGRMADRRSTWVGGHIRQEDSLRARTAVLRRCLKRELEEELGLTVDVGQLPEKPSVVIWDVTTPASRRHVALYFDYHMPTRTPREKLHNRELFETPEKSLFTYFADPSSAKDMRDLEPWSQVYLREVHGLAIAPKVKQGTIV